MFFKGDFHEKKNMRTIFTAFLSFYFVAESEMFNRRFAYTRTYSLLKVQLFSRDVRTKSAGVVFLVSNLSSGSFVQKICAAGTRRPTDSISTE